MLRESRSPRKKTLLVFLVQNLFTTGEQTERNLFCRKKNASKLLTIPVPIPDEEKKLS